MKRKAILSVYDKTGIEDFARFLISQGVELLSTGGTAKHLQSHGIAFQQVDDYINHPEILGGRVKTLHPKVHGGILARRELQDDLKALSENNIDLIDFVVVNLYPFTKKVKEVESKGVFNHESLIEDIDIGGPTMIRAAAKNWKHVSVICDPSDYAIVQKEITSQGSVSESTRRSLATKVFATMSAYDGAIARYLSLEEKLLLEDGTPVTFAPIEVRVLERTMELRYGENPHQAAGLYQRKDVSTSHQPLWKQLQGKELSYNNLLDTHAALDLSIEVRRALPEKPSAVIIKHSNPCGVALAKSPLEAFQDARACDPVSAFGGIVAISHEVDKPLAESILEQFVEIVIAPSYSKDSMEVFAKKKNVRVIEYSKELEKRIGEGFVSVRNFIDEFLLQSSDSSMVTLSKALAVTEKSPDTQMLSDLELAWRLCKHVKSNTIVIVKDGKAVGIGAGQMSRVDAAHIAISRAKQHGFSIDGSVAASDAFLPFPDTLELLQSAGISALVQPGGSIKDEDVIAAANKLGVVMLFTGERHFRH